MKMKKTLFLLAGVLLLSACSINFRSSRKKHEPLTTKTPEVKPFERIEVAGCFDVFYTQSDSTSVRIEAPASALSKLDIQSDGRTLRIGEVRELTSFSSIRAMEDVKVYVTSPDLVAAEMAGSGDFKAIGHVDTDELRLSIAGSGEISFDDIICNSIKADLAGSGDVVLGNVTTVKASFSIAGSGDIKAYFTQCDKVNTNIAGSGDVKISGHVKQHQESVAGTGEVDVTGVIAN